MATTEKHVKRPCRTCHQGLLWLGGKDYVECPDCAGTGRFELVERITVPTAHSVIVQGLKSSIAVARYSRENP